jgi:ASC-1-like (ASCH) protein
MKTIEFNVQEPYKSFLLSGKKKIEGRLNKGKFKDLETGDVLLFSTGEKFEIQKLKYYDSFRQMLEMGGTENIIPNANTLEE